MTREQEDRLRLDRVRAEADLVGAQWKAGKLTDEELVRAVAAIMFREANNAHA